MVLPWLVVPGFLESSDVCQDLDNPAKCAHPPSGLGYSTATRSLKKAGLLRWKGGVCVILRDWFHALDRAHTGPPLVKKCKDKNGKLKVAPWLLY